MACRAIVHTLICALMDNYLLHNLKLEMSYPSNFNVRTCDIKGVSAANMMPPVRVILVHFGSIHEKQTINNIIISVCAVTTSVYLLQ